MAISFVKPSKSSSIYFILKFSSLIHDIFFNVNLDTNIINTVIMNNSC